MKKILAGLSLLLFLARPALAAIAFDALSTGSVADSPAPSAPLTISHTGADAHDDLAVVGIAWRVGSGITTVTADGAPFTQIRSDDGDSGFAHGDLWYLTNPPSGTYDVVITTSDGVCRAAVVVTYTGVDPIDSVPTNAGDVTDGSPVDVVITTAFTDSWIFAVGSTQNNRTLTELADYTDRGDVTTSPDWVGGYGLDRGPLAAGAWTPGWTHGDGGIDNTISATEIKEKIPEDGQKMRCRHR
jgi:hypothetical protein